MTRARARGQIITFYSFKGGVGRSMALANVATILAQQDKRVLALDFDFEAPGLHRYFMSAAAEAELAMKERILPKHEQRGLIDFFRSLRKRLREALPVELYDPKSAEALGRLRAIVQELLQDPSYRYEVRLRNPNKDGSRSPSLDFMTAGRFSSKYADRVRSFNWQTFYRDYAEVFSILSDELRQRYDYVLIDSRTGFTDAGSVCTMVLPDKLVLVFTPNYQSLSGALEVGEQAARQRGATGERPLPLFPLLSRLEDSEEVAKREWVRRSRESFEALFRDVYGLEECDLEAYFNLARIYHRGYYGYGERIAAEEEQEAVAGSMAESFSLFAGCLEQDSPADVYDKQDYNEASKILEGELRRRLAINMRRLRQGAGLSLKAAAARAEMHWRLWQKLEEGSINAALFTIVRVASALDVDAAALLQDPPQPAASRSPSEARVAPKATAEKPAAMTPITEEGSAAASGAKVSSGKAPPIAR